LINWYKKGLNLILPDDIESANDSTVARVFFADGMGNAYVHGKKIPYPLGYFVYLAKEKGCDLVFSIDNDSPRNMIRCLKEIQGFYSVNCCSNDVPLLTILSSDARFLVYSSANREQTLEMKLMFWAIEDLYSEMPIRTISEMDYVTGIVFNSDWYHSTKIKEIISYALGKGKEICFNIGANKDFIDEAERVASIADEIKADVGIFCNHPRKVREALAGI
jgi:hypothetical protein